MDSVICVNEYFHEWFDIHFVDLAKSLSHQTEEFLISSLLSAAINDHVAQLQFLTRFNIQLVQFVDCLLEIQRGLNCQVNGSSQ